MSSPILEVANLSKQYPNTLAVDDISFAIEPRICFGLLGPNGAGKTTTIEIIEGIVAASSGRIYYKGQPLGQQFKEQAGIQFQSTALQDFLTVGETLDLFAGLYPNTLPREELVALCQLQELLGRDTSKLSGGQRQRLLLAIALVNDPEIVFLDEPTTGLDPHARRLFWDLVEHIKNRGKTIILTTHYMEEANELCDEIAIMDKGKIIAQGSPHALLSQHFNDSIISLDSSALGKHEPEALSDGATVKNNKIIIATEQVQQVIARLVELQIPMHSLQIRPRTLEDLFIHVTTRNHDNTG